MVSWNYRVVRYKSGDGYGLHEVFYNKSGEAHSMTVRPVGFVGDDCADLRASFDLAMLAFASPVFEEPEVWAKMDGDEGK